MQQQHGASLAISNSSIVTGFGKTVPNHTSLDFKKYRFEI